MQGNGMELNNTILRNEICAYKSESNQENLISLLHCLHESVVFVPGKVVNKINEDGVNRPEFTPAVIKNKNGVAAFPVLISQKDAPVIGGKKIAGLYIPFLSVCKMVEQRPDCDLIMINPFSDRFPVIRQMYRNVMKLHITPKNGLRMHERRVLNKDNVKFFKAESADEAFINKSINIFKQHEQINEVYFARMLSNEQLTYLFVVDCDIKGSTALFGELSKKLIAPDVRLPLGFAPKASFKQFLDDENIISIYKRNDLPQE